MSLFLCATGESTTVPREDSLEARVFANLCVNDDFFYDPDGSLHLLNCWIEGCWNEAANDRTHSPAFAICQSSGVGKSKLVRQLAKQEHPFWVFHMVCSQAQMFEPCPIITQLHEKCNQLLRDNQLSREQVNVAMKRRISENEEPDAKIIKVDNIIAELAQEMYCYFVGFVRFARTVANELALIESLRFPVSEKEVKSNLDAWSDIIKLKGNVNTYRAELKIAFELLAKNKRIVVCFDEAKGLFGPNDSDIDDQHSLVFRGIRRASIHILLDLVKNDPLARSVFVFIDTNSGISKFVAPMGVNGSPYRGIDYDISVRPFFSLFPLIMTHNLFSRDFIEKDLKWNDTILVGREKDTFRTNDAAQALLSNIGRPLWHFRFNRARDFTDVVKFVVDRALIAIDQANLKGGDINIVSIRLPFRLNETSGVASEMVAKFFGKLIFAAHNPSMASVRYLAEPAVAAMASRLFELHPELVFPAIKDHLNNLGINAGAGGEIATMLIALASTDHCTEHKPYLAVKVTKWLSTFIGCSVDDLKAVTLAYNLDDALIACGQFVPFDLSRLNWKLIKTALVQGVAIVPASSKQKAIDMVIPFEYQDGTPGAFFFQVKNRQLQLDPEEMRSLVNYCLSIHNPYGFHIIPVYVMIAHGRGMLPTDVGIQSPHEKAQVHICYNLDTKVYSSLDLNLTQNNSWSRPSELHALFSGMQDDSLKESRFWEETITKFNIPGVANTSQMIANFCGIGSVHDFKDPEVARAPPLSSKRQKPSVPSAVKKTKK